MRPAKPELLLAVGIVALALVVAYGTTEIPVSPLYSKIGPTVFPYMVVIGLAALGLALLVAALGGGWTQDDGEGRMPPDLRALGWLLVGLLLNVALISFLGFVIASILLFTCVARAFGSTRVGRDALIGAILALVTYLGFDRVLGFSIGAGILEGII
jgi:putative tricarboxylic transport membrane protein